MEIIRLSGYLDEVPLRRKLDVLEKIYHENQQFSVHELCEALGVARFPARSSDTEYLVTPAQILLLRHSGMPTKSEAGLKI